MGPLCIKQITLVNFKSHKSTTVSFDQITSIIGSSNSGKSHIYRALKLALYNEAFSEKTLYYGSNSASITVEFSDGRSVTRKRTKTSQEVSIIDLEGQTHRFTGMKDASGYITKILGFRRLVVNPSTPNVAETLNFMGVGEISPLITGSQPASIQKRLALLLGTDSIIKAYSSLSKEEAALGKTVSSIELSLDSIKQEYDDTKDKLDAVDGLVKQVEKVAKLIDEKTEKLDNITELGKAYIECTHILDTFSGLSKVKEKCERLENSIAVLSMASLVTEVAALKKQSVAGEALFKAIEGVLVEIAEKKSLLAALKFEKVVVCPVCSTEIELC